MDTRRILTFVAIFGLLFLASQFLLPKNGGAAGGGKAYPIYASAAKEPAASEAGAVKEIIQLGNPGKDSKDKLAIWVNNQTAGIDKVQLNVNDYPARVDRKEPLTLIEATPGLAKPFATLGLHVFLGGQETHGPLKEGETAASANSRILYESQYVWKVEDKKVENGATIEVTLLMTALAGGQPVAEIRKTFTIDPASYDVRITHSVKNLVAGQSIGVAIDQLASTELPRDNPQGDDRYFHAAGLNIGQKKINTSQFTFVQAELQKLESTKDIGQCSDFAKEPVILWTAASSRFFAVITRALPAEKTPAMFELEDKRTHIPEVHHVASANVDVMRHADTSSNTAGAVRLTGNLVEIRAGETAELPLTVYMGPKKQSILGGTDATEPTTEAAASYIYGYSSMIQYNPGGPCYFLTFDWLAKIIMVMLDWLAHYVTFGNYGVAIIVLVIVVRLALHPLTRASQINMAVMAKKMKQVAPQIEAAKRKYEKNKQKQTEETMRIYRENQVNPAGGIMGCLPLLIQMPIWAALYSGLRVNIDLRLAPFIPGWINDLSNPDTIWPRVTHIGDPLFVVPLLGMEIYGLNLLPLLLAGVFFFQMKVQTASQPKPADEQQAQMQKMSQYMIFIFPLFLYGAPSGLNLYIFASTMGGLLDTYLVRKTLKKKGILPATAEALPTHEEKD